MKVNIQRIIFYNFIIIVLFFTVVSPQLINPYIENTSLNTSTIHANSANNRLPGIRNSVITGLVSGTTYTPGSTVEVAGFLDYMQQYVNVISDPGAASNNYQFVPAQSNISIYLQNPNNPSYKLNIVGGSHRTTTTLGGDALPPYGVDDYLYKYTGGYTYLTTTNTTQKSEISSIYNTGSVGYFDIQAAIPDNATLASLGIGYGQVVNLYVVYGGNTTSGLYTSPNLPSWNISMYSITISNKAVLQTSVPPVNTTIVPTAPRNNATFTLSLTDGGVSPIPFTPLNFAVYNNDTDPNHTGTPLCSGVTNGTSTCNSTNNIYLAYFPSVTNSNGEMNFTVGLLSWSSVTTIYHYAFKIFADFTGSNLYANNPYVLENFTFERQQGNMQILSKNPNTTIFRPGENVNITVQSYLNATRLAFPNVPISTVQLYYRNNNTAFPSGTNGFTVLYGTGITNTSGLLTLILKTTAATATGSYGLKVQANYTSYTGSPNYIVNNLTSSTVWYNFSIDTMYDNFALTFYSAVPYNTTTITPQPAPGNITQVVFKASILYNTSWLSYHTGYPASAPAANIPINASLTIPGSNLILSIANIINNPLNTTGYYYTNSTGYIVFTINATYPLTYLKILESMILKVNLPGNNTDKFIRYYNTSTHSYTTTPSFVLPTTGSFSIDPGYTPINVVLDSPATNATFIHPGDWITLNFKAIYTNNLTAISGVPISFSISATTVTGISLTAMNGTLLTISSYLITNASGEISIILRSTYGVTIESITSIVINIVATANITLFNKLKNTNQPSTYTRPYYTGMYHQGTDTFTHYSNTWSNVTSPVTLKAGYTFGIPSWQNLIKIRPGIGTNFTMTVVNNNTLVAINGIRFPVNVTALCYADSLLTQQFTSCPGVGVSITIPDLKFNPAFNSTFYYTNSSNAMLKIHIQTTLRFSPNPLPKFIYIRLNATIDFLNKTSSTISASALRWIVGTTKIGSYNLSERSLSVNNAQYSQGQVNQDPQYLTATMVAILPTAGQTVQPLNSITLQYRVSMINDTGQTEYLNNVSVKLDTTLLNMDNMTSLQYQNTTLTNSIGIATFNLIPTAKTTDGSYYMQAIANLGANKTLVGTSVKSYWINGTIWTGGNNTYSNASTLTFTVNRVPTLSVNVLKVFASTSNTIFSASAPFQARRGDTLELNITNKDNLGDTYASSGSIAIFYNTTSNIVGSNSILITTLGQISASGILLANVTLPVSNKIIIGSSIIWANDTGNPATKPVLNGAQVEVITTVSFASRQYSTYGKTFLTTGDQVTVSGVLEDDLGNAITSTLYPSNILGELTNNLLIYGSATNNASAIGIQATTPNTTTGAFTINFTLPSGYAQQTLPIYIDLKNDSIAIPDFIHTPLLIVSVNTYQYLHPLELQLSGTGISFTTSSNNANYHIDNNTHGYSLTITVVDQFNRPVSNFTFTAIANITQILNPLITNTAGQLVRVASLSEYTNTTLTPRIITMQYKNGTVTNIWSLTITRTVYDRTPPTIAVVQPVSPNNTAIYQNTFINITFSDGNPTTMVATGINITSYTIIIKDNNNNTLSLSSVLLNLPACSLSSNGYTYICTATLNYTSLSTSVTSITMTIFVRDNGIESSTLNYVLTFDRSAPQFNLTSITPANNTYIAAHANLSIRITDNDRNGVSTVSAQVTIGSVTTNYQLTQTNTTTHTWSSPSIDFSSMAVLDKNAKVVFIASDPAGNTNTTTILYVADIIKPSIAIDNYNSLENSIQFAPFSITVRVSDTQSGINASSLVLTQGQVKSLINQSVTSSNGIYSYVYTILVTPNINGLTTNQGFSIGITDNAGNSNTTSMSIRTDINPPVLQSIQVTNKNNNTLYQYSQPSTSTNTSFTDTGVSLNSDHKLIFFYNDPTVAGISSGINTAGTTVTLLVYNRTTQQYQTINFNALGLGVRVIIGANNVTISWQASSNDTKLIGLSGQSGTGSFNIGLQWVINLKDNAGHTVPITFDYTYQVYVPTILDFIFSTLTTAIIAIAIFGVAGIIIAVVYERIRFEK